MRTPEALRQDYQAMLAAQMFYGDILEFEPIVARLRRLEANPETPPLAGTRFIGRSRRLNRRSPSRQGRLFGLRIAR